MTADTYTPASMWQEISQYLTKLGSCVCGWWLKFVFLGLSRKALGLANKGIYTSIFVAQLFHNPTMPTTRSQRPKISNKPNPLPTSRRTRSSTSQSKRGKRGRKSRAAPPRQPSERVDSEERQLAATLDEQEPEQQGDLPGAEVEPGPQNVDPEEDFGLQQLMNAATINDHAEQPAPEPVDAMMQVDPLQVNTTDGTTGTSKEKDQNGGTGIQQLKKLPRPFGTSGRHFNLQKEMGLQSNRKLYNQVQRETRWAINQANLPLISFKQQDPRAIFAITQAPIQMTERFPFLQRFVRPAVWPITEMIKLLLRNRRAHHRAMGIPEPGANMNVGMEVD